MENIFQFLHFSFYRSGELGWGKEIYLWFQRKLQSFRTPCFYFFFRNVSIVIFSKPSKIFIYAHGIGTLNVMEVWGF